MSTFRLNRTCVVWYTLLHNLHCLAGYCSLMMLRLINFYVHIYQIFWYPIFLQPVMIHSHCTGGSTLPHLFNCLVMIRLFYSENIKNICWVGIFSIRCSVYLGWQLLTWFFYPAWLWREIGPYGWLNRFSSKWIGSFHSLIK